MKRFSACIREWHENALGGVVGIFFSHFRVWAPKRMRFACLRPLTEASFFFSSAMHRWLRPQSHEWRLICGKLKVPPPVKSVPCEGTSAQALPSPILLDVCWW